MKRRRHTLSTDLDGERYRAVLDEATRHCRHFSLIERPGLALAASARDVLAALEPHLRDLRIVSEWPGTQLLNGATATWRQYELTPTSADILQRVATGLYDWTQPARLEDLVLWRHDGTPWLVTTAHEREAYFELTTLEYDALLDAVPSLANVLRAAAAGSEW